MTLCSPSLNPPSIAGVLCARCLSSLEWHRFVDDDVPRRLFSSEKKTFFKKRHRTFLKKAIELANKHWIFFQTVWLRNPQNRNPPSFQRNLFLATSLKNSWQSTRLRPQKTLVVARKFQRSTMVWYDQQSTLISRKHVAVVVSRNFSCRIHSKNLSSNYSRILDVLAMCLETSWWTKMD